MEGGRANTCSQRGGDGGKKSGSDTGVDKADTYGFLWKRRLHPLAPYNLTSSPPEAEAIATTEDGVHMGDRERQTEWLVQRRGLPPHSL